MFIKSLGNFLKQEIYEKFLETFKSKGKQSKQARLLENIL